MKAIILAGGKGTRLAPYTTVLPKPLMPLGDRPILDLIVRQLRRCGITDVTMAVGHLADLIRAYFGSGDRYGVRISYSREEQPLGTAGPLGIMSLPQEPFLVLNGDVLASLDFRAMVEEHADSGAIATIGVYPRKVKVDFGRVVIDADDRVLDYVEKPRCEVMVSVGVYAFSPQVAEYVQPNQYLELPDLIQTLIAAGHDVRVYRKIDFWLDIGQPEDYEAAQADVSRIRDRLLPNDDACEG
jgi:NDP-sugar pyrophosphorylase family protein